MAKVVETVRGETTHTVKLNQRELDIIVGLLSQCWCRGETALLYNALSLLREQHITFVDGQGAPLPTIMISKKEEQDD